MNGEYGGYGGYGLVWCGMVWWMVNGGWEREGRRKAGPAAVVICGATSGHRGVVLDEKLRLNMILNSDRRDSQSGCLSAAAVAVPSSTLRFLMLQTRDQDQARPCLELAGIWNLYEG